MSLLGREPIMLYLDANVFVYAATNTSELGEKASALLERIQSWEETAKTSVLTFDEVFWAVKKITQSLASKSAKHFLIFRT